eukprot:s787_g3.t1
MIASYLIQKLSHWTIRVYPWGHVLRLPSAHNGGGRNRHECREHDRVAFGGRRICPVPGFGNSYCRLVEVPGVLHCETELSSWELALDGDERLNIADFLA